MEIKHSPSQRIQPVVWRVILAMLLVVPWAATLSPQAAAQPQAEIEIEPELLQQLAADETGAYLIYFRERADLSAASTLGWSERGWFVVEALQQTAARTQAAVRTHLDASGASYQPFWIDNLIVVERSNRATFDGLLAYPEIAALRAYPIALAIEPPDGGDPAASGVEAVEANLSHIGADQVWALGYEGQGLVVASIDTGVRYTHQALSAQYRGNLGGGVYDHNYNWLGAAGGSMVPTDDGGHGTHVAGILLGDDGGANQIGVAPAAQWIACDGCESGYCPGTPLLTCAQWLAAPYPIGDPSSPDPDKRPHVVNNSWTICGSSYNAWFQGVVDSWHAAGIYPVFATGNAGNCGYPSPPGCNTVGNPARYGNVTAVGATGQTNGQVATYSLWGPTDDPDTVNPRGYPSLKPQVVAPGTGIRSSYAGSDNQYATMSGTSMAAPHVAGLVALMWNAGPCLAGDYATTETILETTATPIAYATGCGGEGPGNVPNMAAGWGEINALAAVQAALGLCIGYLPVVADYSDLAASYGVAWHAGNGSLKLGNQWDADTSFSPASDDATDDGVTIHPDHLWAPGAAVVVNVVANGGTSARYLAAWFDWNDDGDFADPSEKPIGQPVYQGINNITFVIPAGAGYVANRPVYARFRLYESEPPEATAWGGADGGEVEDYLLVTPSPTAVELLRFEAMADGATVQIEWETAAELNNLGFTLYRSEAPGGPLSRLNEALIPGQPPGSPVGGVYAWRDETVLAGETYAYWLEWIDTQGAPTLHGPATITLPGQAPNHLHYLPLIRQGSR